MARQRWPSDKVSAVGFQVRNLIWPKIHRVWGACCLLKIVRSGQTSGAGVVRKFGEGGARS
ncbi:hypothetical protein AVEN_66453-1, partial [Araneus ventricosus]